MSNIDYMKVIDIIAKTFDVAKTYELNAHHDKVDIFDVTMEGKDITRNCRIYMRKYELQIEFNRDYYDMRGFNKWLGKFEYELEQEFLRNIKLDVDHDSAVYKVIVHF